MKQPHEDVTGIDRTGDDLLSLDERGAAHRRALIALAHHLQTAVSVGSPAPVVERMGSRIRSPQIGDFVVETSRVLLLGPRVDVDTMLKGSGFLVEHREEWWHADEEYERLQAEDPESYDERMTDRAWYVQYGPEPGDICRWTNSSFLAVPIEPDGFELPAGHRDGTAVVFTRDSLLASLADSGFELNVSR